MSGKRAGCTVRASGGNHCKAERGSPLIIEGERVPDNKGGQFPKLTLAHVLHCKRELDPHEYDPDRLIVLWRHRERRDSFDPLPPPEPLPEPLLAERRQWGWAKRFCSS
jgi:hypothetical protein